MAWDNQYLLKVLKIKVCVCLDGRKTKRKNTKNKSYWKRIQNF